MADLNVRVVKELKGAPLSVWMALMFAGGVPVNKDWLGRNTGYTDKPVRQALAYLVEHGFVIQAGRGWMISEDIYQLPVVPVLEEPSTKLEDRMAAQDHSDRGDPDRNNSDSAICIKDKGIKDSNDSKNTNSKSRKISDNIRDFADFPELGEALLGIGIRENVRTRRLLGRITPLDVRAMAARIRDDPFHDLSETGLMVTILEGVAERNQRRGGYESWNS